MGVRLAEGETGRRTVETLAPVKRTISHLSWLQPQMEKCVQLSIWRMPVSMARFC